MTSVKVKTLVVFYSLDGNTRSIAKTIQQKLDADILELRLKKPINPKSFFKYFWGGFQVISRSRPQLLPLDKDPRDYQLIFIGTPVWAGNYVSAFRTFLSSVEIKRKKIALFCCCGGQNGKTIDRLKKALPGNEFLGEMTFINPLKKDSKGSKEKVQLWAQDMMGKTKSS